MFIRLCFRLFANSLSKAINPLLAEVKLSTNTYIMYYILYETLQTEGVNYFKIKKYYNYVLTPATYLVS